MTPHWSRREFLWAAGGGAAAGLAVWRYTARERAADSTGAASWPEIAVPDGGFVDHDGWMLFPVDKEKVGALSVGESGTPEP
jgi:hypothetical protein